MREREIESERAGEGEAVYQNSRRIETKGVYAIKVQSGGGLS